MYCGTGRRISRSPASAERGSGLHEDPRRGRATAPVSAWTRSSRTSTHRSRVGQRSGLKKVRDDAERRTHAQSGGAAACFDDHPTGPLSKVFTSAWRRLPCCGNNLGEQTRALRHRQAFHRRRRSGVYRRVARPAGGQAGPRPARNDGDWRILQAVVILHPGPSPAKGHAISPGAQCRNSAGLGVACVPGLDGLSACNWRVVADGDDRGLPRNALPTGPVPIVRIRAMGAVVRTAKPCPGHSDIQVDRPISYPNGVHTVYN